MPSAGLHRIVLAISICFILCGLSLTSISLFSASWQVVEIHEFQAEHHHGIWWDCVRSDRYLIPLSRIGRSDMPRSALKCAYKLDLASQEALANALADGEATTKEMQLHRFLPQHKAVIFFATFTFIFGLISIIIGLCSPCFTPNALLCSVALFLTTSCSALADVIFFFAAMRMDTRFVHGIVDVYEQRIGYAAILHILATVMFLLSLVFSLLAAYLLISSRGTAECCCFITEYQFDCRQEPYTKWRSRSLCAGAPRLSSNGGTLLQKCDAERCRPFVVMSDESST